MQIGHETNGSQRRTAKTASGHVIERGVPIPELLPVWQRGDGAGRRAALDISDLAIGDSVFISAKTKPAMARARQNAISAARRANYKVTARSVDGGIRVWRVA